MVDQILNRDIKEILKDLSETVPTLAVKMPTKLTMKQKEKERTGELTVERNDKGDVMMPRYDCVTTHTARRSGITNIQATATLMRWSCRCIFRRTVRFSVRLTE